MDTYDGRIHHPFNCLVAGPSKSGKSTFVKNLLECQESLIDVKFDYVLVLIGTGAGENKLLTDLVEKNPLTHTLIQLNKVYPSAESLRLEFPRDFTQKIRDQHEKGKMGCVIFDDLMSELADCGILVDLFTKYSSHYNISTINITQNVFFKSGKRASDNVTVYRNCHVLVLFPNIMDSTVVSTIAKRVCSDAYSDALYMFSHILEKHRYVVIFGELTRNSRLRFATDLFAESPVRHQKVYELTESCTGEDGKDVVRRNNA